MELSLIVLPKQFLYPKPNHKIMIGLTIESLDSDTRAEHVSGVKRLRIPLIVD